jgi:beta-lactam-binding protein with PASTA domain
VEVPNVIRQLLAKAVEILEEAGLSKGEVVEQKGILPIGVSTGEVLKQDPKPGTKIPTGSPVKLVIASKAKLMPRSDRERLCDSFSDSN